tara:strand:+ start:809 stop:1240 length:432 start_codon:yes stop_codon:yes gene_type:complete
MKKFKILIMGLPGAGKTTLASKLVPLLNAEWLNADKIRKEANDWDFSENGRIRQAKRMADTASKMKKNNRHVVADFICPTEEARKYFNADYIVWLNTIKEGRFEDTNHMFEPPKKCDFEVSEKNADFYAKKIFDDIMIKSKMS